MVKGKLSAVVPILLAVSLIFAICFPSFAESGSSQVAGADEMAAPQEVGSEEMTAISGEQVDDGQYEIDVDSSSSMFRIVKAVLTVEDGKMSAVLTLSGKGYGKLFMGTGEEAVLAESSSYIPFQEDENGAYTYEVPVEALDRKVKCAAWSTRKEKWYDRDIVFLSDRIPKENIAGQGGGTGHSEGANGGDSVLAGFSDGLYRIGVTLLGGSGKASVSSPAELKIKDGQATVRLEWSSPNYDYMVVDGVRYEPVNTEGNSVFEIPVSVFDEDFFVTADTTAMSTPHEIEYQLRFDSSSITPDETAERGAKESARDKSVSPLIIAGAAVLIFAGLVIGVIAGRRIAAKKKTR